MLVLVGFVVGPKLLLDICDALIRTIRRKHLIIHGISTIACVASAGRIEREGRTGGFASVRVREFVRVVELAHNVCGKDCRKSPCRPH